MNLIIACLQVLSIAIVASILPVKKLQWFYIKKSTNPFKDFLKPEFVFINIEENYFLNGLLIAANRTLK